ncbi:MAG: peptide chain release factor N(5)-glutamine methyltransferase [Planctomycetes bacterium]|nr:peptide chain release factor N(5)-glutamine methyltransferase [Planctomycetota bacterium]
MPSNASPSGTSLTVSEVLEKTRAWFAARGIPSPRLEAELLAAHVLGCDRTRLLAQFDRPLTGPESEALRDLVRRRAAGTPAAYLIGHREFFGLSFSVTPDVLIPRPETEHLVEAAIEVLRSHPERVAQLRDCAIAQVDRLAAGMAFADVGTGSGAIVVAVAKHAPQTAGWATDLSAAALRVASGNALRHGVSERITFLEGDLAEPLLKANLQGRLDLVCANLPYVADGEATSLPREVVDHEPRLALFAGPDGLSLLRRLITDVPALLRPGGTLLLEVGAGQASAVLDLLAATGAFATMGTIRDLAGIERVVRAKKSEVRTT